MTSATNGGTTVTVIGQIHRLMARQRLWSGAEKKRIPKPNGTAV
jgi:hypothetical protein